MKVLIAGDFCERYRVADLISKSNYKELFDEDVRNIIKRADYSIVNFEFPIVLGEKKPIEKCGPNLKGTPKSIEAIQYAGFNCATLANNHILDYGPEALMDTNRLLEEKGIDTVGAGADLEDARKVLYKTINGMVLAIVNCCEHEFSIATNSTPGANPLNPVQQFYSIQEARKKANYVLVIVHGGHEHWQLPSPRMVETYRYFIDCGADAVVNHHQHCYSGSEVYNGKPIIYGLGNFCFDGCDTTRKKWNRGVFVNINFVGEIKPEFIPYIQNEDEPGVFVCIKGSREYDEIIKDINTLSEIINNQSELYKAYNMFINSTNTFYKNAFEPYNNYYLKALHEKGILPSCINKEKKKLLFNLIACESHRERLLNSLFREF